MDMSEGKGDLEPICYKTKNFVPDADTDYTCYYVTR